MFFGNNQTQDTPPPAQDAGGVIFNVETADFEARVVAASMETPVIAYLSTPGCQPCKQFGPILEAAVQAAGGKVLLAKINLEENQELAQALRVQSVPTVFAFFQGQPIDAFQGAQPESQTKAFVDKVVQAARQAQPDALDIPEALKGAAEALAAGDFMAAQAIYAQILQQDEKNAPAYAGLVRLFIAAGQLDQARQMVENAPEDIASHAMFGEAKTALELAELKPDGSLTELAQAVEAKPEDHQARYDLATAQFAAGEKPAAIENLLEILRKDREWNEEEARKQMLKFFEALGPVDPLTIESRKKLSSILFS